MSHPTIVQPTTPPMQPFINKQGILNKDYAEYASAYIKYLDCADGSCPYPSPHPTMPSNATVMTDIAAISNNPLPTTDPFTQMEPMTPLDGSYNDMTQHRSDLDLKLQQLYNIDNSIPNLYQSQLDSTVYSGVLWTILATTLIYYVFIKL